MIKRIQKISNVGCLQNLRAADIQFSKVTFVYGENCHGKTTLASILSSLQHNTPVAVTSRKTIPLVAGQPEVKISIQEPGKNYESSLTLSSGEWQQTLPDSLALQVYDEGFYHRNVFSGQTFSRTTKEGFTSVVLGSHGVAKAEEIGRLVENRDSGTRRLRDLRRTAFHGIEDIDAFTSLDRPDSIVEVESELDRRHNTLRGLQSRQTNLDSIRKRELPTDLSVEWGGPQGLIEQLRRLLATSLTNTHGIARDAVLRHIQNHFASAEGAENWLRQGLQQNNRTNCQFCGQALEPSALEVIAMYHQYFDADYSKQEKLLRETLPGVVGDFAISRTGPIREAISANRLSIARFPELNEEDAFRNSTQLLDEGATVLENAIRQYDESMRETASDVARAAEAKQASPLEELALPEMTVVVNAWSHLVEALANYNRALRPVLELVEEFRGSAEQVQIEAELLEEKEAIGKCELLRRRVELHDVCEEFSALSSEVESVKQTIERLRGEIREDQSEYLGRYFAMLNSAFQTFGSRDFSLETGQSDAGKQPVVYLQVKYKGQEVTEEQLATVFSESDRRALALSVFWAQLEAMDAVERSETVVVLDDPVTSFDEHRIDAINGELYAKAEQFRQLVVLSHFRHPVIRFLKSYVHGEVEVALLKLGRSAGDVTLRRLDLDEFTMDEHRKQREDLFKFADGSSDTVDVGALRVFFELEFELRFRYQLGQFPLRNVAFAERIQMLKEASAISEDVARTANSWRMRLNPSHHEWSTLTLEDKRNTTSELLRFTYHELRPATEGAGSR